MLEIFAIPYLAISGVIGWLIFQPFLPAHQSESLLPAKITTTDLLAIALPISIIFSFARLITPLSNMSISMQATMAVIALLIAIPWLTAGLFLVPKTFQVTFFKRLAIMGIIAPFGILLTIGWIGFLIWACAYSLLYSVPSTIAIAAATFGLRILSVWVCQHNPNIVVEGANEPDTINEDH